ncbi:hypothetical protein [Wolinella succinogenes]|uniref:hypothetical protein n=1 Tax=Wolinella succinogenes TaxID=844 RepID=UPI00240A9A32|nr:hypothetical protein [Wolinella succinogenes]
MLYDIKELQPLPLSLSWLEGGELLLALLFLGVLSLALWRYFHRPLNPKERALEALRALDPSKPKSFAYGFSRYGSLVIGDSSELKERYEKLVRQLEPHKYRASVPPLKASLLEEFWVFMEMAK